MNEAIALLEPMTRDLVPFVRQGAFIALAMVLIQVSEKAEPKVKEIRQQFFGHCQRQASVYCFKIGRNYCTWNH